MKACRVRTTNLERVGHTHHAGNLVISRITEFTEVFDANRRLQRDRIGYIGLQVDVESSTVLFGGRVIREPAKAV